MLGNCHRSGVTPAYIVRVMLRPIQNHPQDEGCNEPSQSDHVTFCRHILQTHFKISLLT